MGPFDLRALSPGQVLAALAVGAAVIVLHLLLRPPPRAVEVASHHLWAQVLPRRAHPLWKEVLLVALQVVAIVALILAWADPAFRHEAPRSEESSAPTQRVFVLDRSASMAALEADGTARLSLAAERIEREAESLPEAVSFALVLLGREAAVPVPLGRDFARLQLALRHTAVEPWAPAHAPMGPAVDGLPGLEPARAAVEVWTDSPLDDPWAGAAPSERPRLVVRAPFTPTPSLRLDAFDLRASAGLPAEEEAFVRVQNPSSSAAEVEVVIEDGTRVLGRSRLRIDAQQAVERSFRFQPLDAHWLQARLDGARFEGGGTDGFPADDQLSAWVEPVAPLRIAVVGPPNRYLDRVFSVLPGATVHRLDAATTLTDGAAYDAVFVDGSWKGADGPPRAIFLGAAAAAVFGSSEAVHEPTLSDWNHDHPVFRSLVLGDLRLARSRVLEGLAGDERLLGAPDGPLALVRDDGEVRWIGLGFDLAESDLPLRLAFPQFVVQTLLWMRERPGDVARSSRPMWLGDPAPPGAVYAVDGPAGTRWTRPGPATVGSEWVVVGATPSVALDPLPAGDAGPIPRPVPPPPRPEQPDPVLLLLVGAALLLVVEVILWLR